MANAFKTETINFESPAADNLLSLGKTYDKLPAATMSPNERKKEVKKSLPPWMIQPDDKTLNWEHTRERKLLDLRKNPVYQFVMLVTSFTNERMDRYWVASAEKQAEHLRPGVQTVGTVGSGMGNSALQRGGKGSINEANKQFHSYYIDTPWVEGLIYLSPAIYGHLEEAYVAVTQKHLHLANVPLSKFTDTPRIRTMFAKLVAFLIRSSDFISQKRYNLDSTYTRLNMEKRRLMHYWEQVKYQDNTLYYFHSSGRRMDYKVDITKNPMQIHNVGGDEVGLFKLSLALDSNIGKR
jgi:hypothetical protein